MGGRLVYSTCSLNPIENEAVVASLLSTFGPHVIRLVDVAGALPQLPSRKGLSHWRVWHRSKWHETFVSLVERFPRGGKRGGCPPFARLFPPSESEAAEMRLDRCMRLLPHDHDGGGFFIAVFEKVGWPRGEW